MPGFMPGIHVFLFGESASKTWMAGMSPAMTLIVITRPLNCYARR
jgi:hypothetical protein